MKNGAFVAGNHLCWFSKKEEYKSMTVNQVLQKDPNYIMWCLSNLSHLRFATNLSKRIKKAVKEQIRVGDEVEFKINGIYLIGKVMNMDYVRSMANVCFYNPLEKDHQWKQFPVSNLKHKSFITN
jgi:hypothetical protein